MPKIKTFVLQDTRHISPFNQPARDLNILNKPLFLAQRDVLSPHCEPETPIAHFNEIPPTEGETIIYRDNLYFDAPMIDEILRRGREQTRRDAKLGLFRAYRVAFSIEDKAFTSYAVPLSRSITAIYKRSPTGRLLRDVQGKEELDHYEVDFWYYPDGYRFEKAVVPLEVDTGWYNYGYYAVPDYMSDQRDLEHFVTKRTLIGIENWVHLFFANVPLGIFSIGHRFEVRQNQSNFYLLKILFQALIEQTQVLGCSELVHVGKNCTIDPTAIIHGPTFIGDNCTIGPGVVIQNCHIGNNVNIDQGAQLMLSVIGDSCFLPFRASLYLTVLMEHCIVAQNTCLQMCVIGRGTFIGAGNTFTDFNLLPKSIEVQAIDGKLEKVGQKVLGGCVGHNCRIGSGMIVMPGRQIDSDVMLFATHSRRIIRKNISFEESDHHGLPGKISALHRRKYPRLEETKGEEQFLEEW